MIQSLVASKFLSIRVQDNLVAGDEWVKATQTCSPSLQYLHSDLSCHYNRSFLIQIQRNLDKVNTSELQKCEEQVRVFLKECPL